MQIVFFWIPGFRGIKEQGFNIGADRVYSVKKVRHRFILSSELNKTYLPGFFKESKGGSTLLNVSAIVGENGAGKSTALYFLRWIILENFSRSASHMAGIIVLHDNQGNRWVWSNISCEIADGELRELQNPSGWNFSSIYFTPLLSPENSLNSVWPESNEIDISTSNLIYQDWNGCKGSEREKDVIDNPLHPYSLANRRRHFALHSRFRKQRRNLFKKDYLIPEGIFVSSEMLDKSGFANERQDNLSVSTNSVAARLYNAWRDEERKFNLSSSDKQSDLTMIRAKLKRDFRVKCAAALHSHLQKSNRFLDEVNTQLAYGSSAESSFIELFELYMKGTIELKYVPASWSKKTGTKVQIGELLRPLLVSFDLLVDNISLKDVNTTSEGGTIDVDFESHIDLHMRYKSFQRELALLNGIPPQEFIFFRTERGLSSGEQMYLDLYSRLNVAADELQKQIDVGRYPNGEINLFVLIDEGELGLHLRWQRDYVKELVDKLPLIINSPDRRINLQLILTTHSPISLSDIPSSHIVYLQNNREHGGIQVVERSKKTFAGNINDLLYDSFFMDEGSIGEFAKVKIQELVKLLRKTSPKKLSPEVIMLIHEIGDPIIRNRLLDMYKDRNSRVLDLDEEERLLKARLSEIEQERKKNDQN